MKRPDISSSLRGLEYLEELDHISVKPLLEFLQGIILIVCKKILIRQINYKKDLKAGTHEINIVSRTKSGKIFIMAF